MKTIGLVAVAVSGVLVGVGGVLFGVIQFRKREDDKDKYSESNKKKDEKLSDVEMRDARLFEQNKEMAKEIARLRKDGSFGLA